jgi:hypothetical protein
MRTKRTEIRGTVEMRGTMGMRRKKIKVKKLKKRKKRLLKSILIKNYVHYMKNEKY